MDRWQSQVIPCQGGLILDLDALTQGGQYPGSARVLQNYECAIEGGYRRINGYVKFDPAAVTGGTNNPVLGVKVAFNGVFATRMHSSGLDNKIYFSSGAGWTAVSTTARPGPVSKARYISYSITEPVVIQCDGENPAWKWNGTVEATINGVGAPADPKFAAIFRDRLVLAGYTANTSAISLSVPSDDVDFDGGSGAIEINVGDVIVGLRTFRDELYIFCERSIHKLSGSTTDDFLVADVAKTIGCISGDSIQEIGGDLIFLAADGFRSLAATERIGDVDLGLVSKQIQPLARAVLDNNLGANAYSTCVIRKKSQYRLFLNDSNSIEADTVGFIGKLNGRGDTGITYWWSTMRGIKPYCADSDYTGNREIAVIGHPTSGYVFLLESGNTFNGDGIYAVFRTPDIIFEDASLRKVFQKATIFTQVDGDMEFLLNLRLDREGSNIIQPDGITITSMGAVPLYGTAIYGTDTYGQISYPVFYRNLIGSGFTGAFQFSGTNTSSPHRIDSFQVQYALKGRR